MNKFKLFIEIEEVLVKYNRISLAKIKRSEIDLKKSFKQVSLNLQENMKTLDPKNRSYVPLIMENIKKFNFLEKIFAEYMNLFHENISPNQNLKLTKQEKKTIYCLYHSGEYSIDELSQAYNINKAIIDSLIKEKPIKFINQYQYNAKNDKYLIESENKVVSTNKLVLLYMEEDLSLYDIKQVIDLANKQFNLAINTLNSKEGSVAYLEEQTKEIQIARAINSAFYQIYDEDDNNFD